MFVIDMQNKNEYRITNSYENGISFKLEKDKEYYTANIPSNIIGYTLNLRIKLNEDNKEIEEVIYNEKKLENKNIIKLTNYSNYDISYENMPIFMIERDIIKKICIVLVLSIISTIIISKVLIKEKMDNEKSNKKLIEIFTYSSSFFKVLKNKDFLILILVFLITSFIIVGCDAKVIANVGNLFSEDIDIYQLQVNTKLITGREYAEFPYNPLMLCIWGGLMTVFRPITKILPIIGNYPYFEVGILKIFSLLFIFLSISSILSYLLDKNIIEIKRARWIYYLSLFNPVTFYVAILFVQLDALTLYLITIGTLLLSNLNNNRFLGILLLSIGLMLKMQVIFLIPISLIAVLYIILYNCKDKPITKLIRIVKCGIIFLWITLISFLIPYILKTPFYHLESNLAQSERLWYTTIQYTNSTHVYVTLATLVMALMIFVLKIHSKMKKENLILASIIYYAVIIFLFSFSILPTPSIYIVTLAGITILLALEKDKLKNVIMIVVSILIIICPMFSDYGDISKIIKNPNEQGIITSFINKLPENNYKKVNSIIFTISAVSMLTYSIYMGKEAIRLLEERIKENV